MPDFLAVMIWWLLLQAMGWVALPLVFRLLRWLPDRGYSVAKPAGLLLGNYVLWLLGTLGWLRNTEGGILIAFAMVALFSVWVYRRWNDGPKLIGWLRAHASWVIAYEAVFLIALVGWAIFRAHSPDLSTTEKPMEFAFMNAIGRSATFPPHDPWLSGFAISYYYFGYVMMATLAKLSGVASGVAFALSNALWFALTAAGAFGIAANLAAASKRAARKIIIATGLLGALFVPVLGNFEAPLDVAHTNAIGPESFWRLFGIQKIGADWLPAPVRDDAAFWRWLDILEINTPPLAKAEGEIRWPFCDGERCPPHPRSWWWWRASRVVHDYPIGSTRSDPAEYQEAIDEFPFFSFLLGDMHPHVLALPYALMALALAFNLFQMSASGDAVHSWREWFWDAAPIGLMYPIFLGGLSFLNTWDFPIHVLIVALAWTVGRWVASRSASSRSAVVSDPAEDVARLEIDPANDEGRTPVASQRGQATADEGARSETGPYKLTEVGPSISVWSDGFIALVACGILGAVAYAPFYIGFRSQAAGVVPNIYNPTAPQQFFVMFGPFLLIGAAFILTLTIRALLQQRLSLATAIGGSLGGGAMITVGVGLLTALGSLAALAIFSGVRAKVEELLAAIEPQGTSPAQLLVERASHFGVPLLLGVVMTVVVLLVWANGRRQEARFAGKMQEAERDTSIPHSAFFVLLLFLVGALLSFAVEYVYLLDFFGTRMNTVFKLYYQTWALWGVASAYVVYYLLWSNERLKNVISRTAFATMLVLIVASGLVYPLLVIQGGTVGRPLHEIVDPQTGAMVPVPIDPTLDARAPTRQFAPDEVAVIDWLDRNAVGLPVVLEAWGDSYRDYTSRVSAWTGLPTVLGWFGHEGQWRGTYDDISPRQPDIDKIYSTTDVATANTLIAKYGIAYVFVGPDERGKYPRDGLAKFAATMDVAFQSGDVILYRVRK